MKSNENYKMSKPLKTQLNMMLTNEQKPIHQELFVEAEFHHLNMKKKMAVKVIAETEEE